MDLGRFRSVSPLSASSLLGLCAGGGRASTLADLPGFFLTPKMFFLPALAVDALASIISFSFAALSFASRSRLLGGPAVAALCNPLLFAKGFELFPNIVFFVPAKGFVLLFFRARGFVLPNLLFANGFWLLAMLPPNELAWIWRLVF
jgi:hypothetical protein